MRVVAMVAAVVCLAACGPEVPSRINMCGACNYPEGSCADLDGGGQAVCTGGVWKTDLTQLCARPVCAVQFPHTYHGEQAWCWFEKGTCH